MSKTTPVFLVAIFLLALSLRFLYFPDNINFAYDQARDSFAALDILKGDLKIIGPPTTISDKIFHGVSFYYFLAPIYFFSNGNIEVAAGFLRIINVIGVFLVFYIGSIIFNRWAGFLAAFFYAVSFEQSQYSLFFGHPALGVTSVLIFYLGLSLLIFKNNPKGLIIALAGLGLTIQAEAVNGFLLLLFFAYIILFKKEFLKVGSRFKILAILTFLLTLSSYILSEIKYDFRTTKSIISLIANFGSGSSTGFIYPLALKRFIHDNLAANDILVSFSLVGLGFICFHYLKKKAFRPKIIFLLIWFFGGLLPYLWVTSFSYYYAPGASVGLLVLFSLSLYSFYSMKKLKIVTTTLLMIVIFSNLSMVLNKNRFGPNPDIVIQQGMILSNQKKVLDYIYEKSEGENFAVNALTIPLNIKTTWDYLFNWYGLQKYGYIPVWGGQVADGYPGKLKVETARSDLPKKRFTIIEPTTGIEQRLIDEFFNNENYFSKVLEEKDFGGIKVQLREQI